MYTPSSNHKTKCTFLVLLLLIVDQLKERILKSRIVNFIGFPYYFLFRHWIAYFCFC